MSTKVSGLIFSAVLGALALSAQGQTSPTGQVTGTQTGATTNCPSVDNTTAAATATSDANCAALAPGFATPSTNAPAPEPGHVIAVVRVDSVVSKPDSFPFPIEFNVVGNATMIRAKAPRLNACFAAGKGWSGRSGAATSTTCLNHKGEVIAYQECKPRSGSEPMQCTTVMPKAEGDTVASVK